VPQAYKKYTKRTQKAEKKKTPKTRESTQYTTTEQAHKDMMRAKLIITNLEEKKKRNNLYVDTYGNDKYSTFSAARLKGVA
jgi:hypothetical protein